MLSVVHALNKPDKKYPSISRSICPPRAQVAPGVRIHLAPPRSLQFSAFLAKWAKFPRVWGFPSILGTPENPHCGAKSARVGGDAPAPPAPERAHTSSHADSRRLFPAAPAAYNLSEDERTLRADSRGVRMIEYRQTLPDRVHGEQSAQAERS